MFVSSTEIFLKLHFFRFWFFLGFLYVNVVTGNVGGIILFLSDFLYVARWLLLVFMLV